MIEENIKIIHETMDSAPLVIVDDNDMSVAIGEDVIFETGVVVDGSNKIKLYICAECGNITYMIRLFDGISSETAAQIAATFQKATEETNADTFNGCGSPV